MADRSRIEWTDATWNPIKARRLDTGKVGWHCERVSEACRHCYAATFNGRNLPNGGTGLDYVRSARDQVEVFVDTKTILQPMKWRKPRRIFVCSMTDLFGDFVTDEQIQFVFGLMSGCGQHTFQVLTKRPERMAEWFATNTLDQCQAEFVIRSDSEEWRSPVRNLDRIRDTSAINGTGLNGWPLPNAWLGCTVEDQERADERIPHLLRCPAAVRFLSVEPMLGAITLDTGGRAGPPRWLSTEVDHSDDRRIDWVIAGAESGRNARPSHPDWFRGLRDQCAAAGVPFFFKQHGEWCAFSQLPVDTLGHPSLQDHRLEDDRYCRVIGAHSMHRVGKKSAGRLLDGVEHSAFPATGGTER